MGLRYYRNLWNGNLWNGSPGNSSPRNSNLWNGNLWNGSPGKGWSRGRREEEAVCLVAALLEAQDDAAKMRAGAVKHEEDEVEMVGHQLPCQQTAMRVVLRYGRQAAEHLGTQL